MNAISILSLSTVFPRPTEESLGLFVRSRLQHVARLANVKVVAPVPWIDYAASGGKVRPVPRQRLDGAIEVFHPRWLYPPHGGVLNAGFLAGRLLPFFRRLRGRYPFQVIDAHFGHPEGIAAGLLAKALATPFTITLRGNETMHAGFTGRRRAMRWAFRRAARLITVSERLRDFAIEMGAEAARVRTIPNGIDTDVYCPRNLTECRARLGIPLDRPALVTAGYLIERKGHHRVIRALGELRREGSAAELWIVGGPGREGNFEAQIHAAVKEQAMENAVHFTGAVPPATLAEYMSAADVFCLATSREGWPNVVHEALGCGAPVVVTDIGGVREMVGSAEHGTIVPPGDARALAAALRDALARQWDRRRIAAWGAARSWTQVAAETAEVLREAAAEGKTAWQS